MMTTTSAVNDGSRKRWLAVVIVVLVVLAAGCACEGLTIPNAPPEVTSPPSTPPAGGAVGPSPTSPGPQAPTAPTPTSPPETSPPETPIDPGGDADRSGDAERSGDADRSGDPERALRWVASVEAMMPSADEFGGAYEGRTRCALGGGGTNLATNRPQGRRPRPLPTPPEGRIARGGVGLLVESPTDVNPHAPGVMYAGQLSCW